jgi:alginate O-acetyltransferase complex protein AlgI
LQVYFDFSGYSDMAIGMAEFFGIHFPENFRRPFLADCITEFWRRWHLTLSSWLRDYLYFSLGGSRKGQGRTYVNLILTMLLAGLWHGAAWNFVLWGGCQGLLLAGERAAGIRPTSFRARPALYSIRALLAFGVFVAGLAVFRAPGLTETGLSLVQMFSGARGASLFNLWQTGLAVCALMLAVLEEWLGWFDRLLTGPLWTYVAALTLMLATLEMFSVTEISIPFVYFQF